MLEKSSNDTSCANSISLHLLKIDCAFNCNFLNLIMDLVFMCYELVIMKNERSTHFFFLMARSFMTIEVEFHKDF